MATQQRNKANYNAYMRQYQKNQYYIRREMYIQEMGGKCAKCESTEQLEFDHINPAEKSFNIGDRLANRNPEVIREELKKCQLLCKECHKQKSTEAKSVGHGEGITGKRNCRCDLCAPLKNAYMRELKRRKKLAKLEQTV